MVSLCANVGLYFEQGHTLIFVDKQEHADELMKNLMKHGYVCMSIHGGIDQVLKLLTVRVSSVRLWGIKRGQ